MPFSPKHLVRSCVACGLVLVSNQLASGADPAPDQAAADRAPSVDEAEPSSPEQSAPRVETMAWRELRLAADRERAIWDRIRAAPDDEMARKRAEAELRDVLTAYENVIRAAPDLAEAYAAYGLLLGRTGNRAESISALLKANKLDPNIPMVKNQLGNIMAEDGNYNQAMAYYLAAIELNGEEPLYHYQLGLLLHAYRDFFLEDKALDRATLDEKMQTAFRRAAELAPDHWPYIYRYAETFYDLEEPDWDAALAEWRKLEAKAPEGLGKQTIRIHIANIMIEKGQGAAAAQLMETITEPALQEQKQSIVARLEESAQK